MEGTAISSSAQKKLFAAAAAVAVAAGGAPRAAVPHETELVELPDSFVSHVGRLAFLEELVLPSLVLHPDRELGVLGVVATDVAVPVLSLVCDELLQTFLPKGR
eukprot:CAMPEP_0198127892 /NCGR_PEP_ID=MMETSP1442-20131203/48214_1 /TAXON_ID= /ORGANISM="Craspedostauros australis, Strain CCMP3328" /LENGTH=103 /DNA_ID=CAMNT_0043787963 /DNA_START=234 /DNA_END=543 /DNA_ORIENTATION=+